MNAARYYNLPTNEPTTELPAEHATTGNITTTIDPNTITTIITNAATNNITLTPKRAQALATIRQSFAAAKHPTNTHHTFTVHGTNLTSTTRIEHHNEHATTHVTITAN